MHVSDSTVAALEVLERHAYIRITEMIDDGDLDAACKIVALLKAVQII